MFYMSGWSNFSSYEEALERFKTFNEKEEIVALQRHSDGSASLVFLQDKPVQHGQAAFNIVGCRLNVVRG